jgi:acyl carrier protein
VSTTPRHDFASFTAALFELLGLDLPATLAPGTSFAEHLAFDSLRMLELLLALEQLGVELTEQDFARIETVGDAFALYLASTASAGHSP